MSTGCSETSPDGKYGCTKHKDGMHLAYGSDKDPPYAIWPFEFTMDSDDSSAEEGCAARSDGYVCTHHQHGYHVAGGSRVYKTWLIEEETKPASLETTKGCDTDSPSGDHYCTHHRGGMHIASDDGPDEIDEIYESWPIEETEKMEQTPGCRKPSPTRHDWFCSYHEDGKHVARRGHRPDDKILVSWPFDTASPSAPIAPPKLESLW